MQGKEEIQKHPRPSQGAAGGHLVSEGHWKEMEVTPITLPTLHVIVFLLA